MTTDTSEGDGLSNIAIARWKLSEVWSQSNSFKSRMFPMSIQSYTPIRRSTKGQGGQRKGMF